MIKPLYTIYVGDSKNLKTRICSNHCTGNVGGSALRRHVAGKMGYNLATTLRPSGSRRIRLELENPRAGEREISTYLQNGLWKFVVCASPDEARDFQWYAIDKLNPQLNINRPDWNRQNDDRYALLLSMLKESSLSNHLQLKQKQSGPGVYVFYHTKRL